MASYYRNTIVHHFVSKAIAEMALIEAATEPDNAVNAFWREADRLKDMFKFEFFYAPTEEFHADIRAEMEFYDKEWEAKLVDHEFVLSFLRGLKPVVAHACLKPYVEAYRIVADCFARLDEGETMDQKATASAALKYGRQAYMQRRISSKASIGQILFKNGHKLLESYGVVEAGGKDLVAKRKSISKDFRILSHRIEQLRALAMPNDID